MLHSESLDYRVKPCLKNKEIPEKQMGNARRSRVRSVQDSQTRRLRPGRYRQTETEPAIEGSKESGPGPTSWRRDGQGETRAKDRRQTGEERGPKDE